MSIIFSNCFVHSFLKFQTFFDQKSTNANVVNIYEKVVRLFHCGFSCFLKLGERVRCFSYMTVCFRNLVSLSGHDIFEANLSSDIMSCLYMTLSASRVCNANLDASHQLLVILFSCFFNWACFQNFKKIFFVKLCELTMMMILMSKMMFFNTLASGQNRGFLKKNTEMHVVLSGNYSAPVRVTDVVKVSKDAASLLVCTQKENFLVGGCEFFVSDVISGGLIGHLGPLCLALGANR